MNPSLALFARTRRASLLGPMLSRGRLISLGAIAVFSLAATRAMAGAESPPESGQPTASATRGTELESVTVEARRRRELVDQQVSQFVYSIAGPGKVESLARWKVPICPAIAGLTVAEADFVEQRVRQIATNAAVPLGQDDCAPNFVVVVTPEPEAMLKDWWAEDHQLFNRDRGLGGVNRMIRTDQPVRVWHNACNVPPLRGYYELSGQLNCGVGMTGSRLTHAAVRAIYSAIVVVDFKQIEGLTFGQVADYATLVGLAQIRPSPELGDVSTILRLFATSGGERPNGLTDWDQSFLKAVYATTDGSVTELSQIKLRMSEELAR